MKVLNATWFISKVSYKAKNENGDTVKVNEAYCIDAVNYTEAEAVTLKHLEDIKEKESFAIKDISEASFKEIFIDEYAPFDQKYYKVKNQFETIDDNGKKKILKEDVLVEAPNIATVLTNFKAPIDLSIEIVSVVLTPIVEIIHKG